MKDPAFWTNRLREAAVLNPVDRISEILFGLIMVLTFTGAISVATDGRQEVRDLLWAALGCNVAWGLVDAIMYLMNVLVERGHGALIIRGIRNSSNADTARTILKDEIQPLISALISNAELDRLTQKLRELPEPKTHSLLTLRDMLAGAEIFLLVFLCTLPVALPFAFFQDVGLALRASNGVALLLLLVGGFILGRYAGFRRGITAVVYALIGMALVSLTMALGG